MMPPPPSSAEARGAMSVPQGLLTGSFFALLVAQFIGAANDATMRFVIPEACKALLPSNMKALAIALPAMCFLVPWIVLSPMAGYLADRFSKQRVLLVCKTAEALCVAALVLALLNRSPAALCGTAILLAAVLALCNPAKLGSIPDLAPPEKISAGNAAVVVTTILALTAGFAYAGTLYAVTFPHSEAPVASGRWYVMAGVMGGVGLVGIVASMFVARLPAADPTARPPWNFVSTVLKDVRELRTARSMKRVVFTYAFYWALGTLAQLTTIAYADDVPAPTAGDAKMWQSVLLGCLALAQASAARRPEYSRPVWSRSGSWLRRVYSFHSRTSPCFGRTVHTLPRRQRCFSPDSPAAC
ncbi:MAG: MFS transporter [Pirellulales bacterium]